MPVRTFAAGLTLLVTVVIAAQGSSIGAVRAAGASQPEPPVCLEPPPGIVSLWPADGNANDVIGGHDGTLEGGATLEPGLIGQAFAFDRRSRAVSVPHHPDLDPGAASFTFGAWVKANTFGPTHDTRAANNTVATRRYRAPIFEGGGSRVKGTLAAGLSTSRV